MSLSSDFVPPLNRPGEYPFGQLFGRSDLNLAASTSVIDGLPDEQRTSPVRRTFLLVMLFDLLLCFTLWIIYVQQAVSDGNIEEAMRKEVLHYSFKTSLFDSVIFAAFRFLVIEVVYGAFVARTPWWSGAVTGMTCVFFVIKCFLFDFHQNNRNPSGLVYVIIVAALIFTWLETSFLIYRVIPKEKAAAQIAECLTIEDPNETRSLLGNLREPRRVYSTYAPSIGGYYTPVGSMFAVDMNQATSKTSVSREAAVDIAAMLNRASQIHSEVWYLYRLEAWGPDSVTSEQHSIRSADLPGYNSKVFRLETILDASPQAILHDLVFNITETSSWNPTIDYIECIQSLPSENIDIVHNVIRESLNGAISRRAQQPISALVLEAISGELNRCKAVWIMCFDLKLYLPQRLIDRALSTELSSMLTGLQQRVRTLQDTPQSDEQLLQTVTSQVTLVVPQPKWCVPMKRQKSRLSSNKREGTISEGDNSSDESGDKTRLLSVPR
ncbi:StAR-related lipid transfer protein 3 [Paragonimus westermani]|uniref:StAR-related lipid transfer protein 3 n=1 Tax=Paragonimus westermani TaxID=34504 RepID=A0A5J4P0I0_9TREM|nr:StAR-related lipid transfer protein 3 [Paragonimus westermani]